MRVAGMVEPASVTAAHAADYAVPVGVFLAMEQGADIGNTGDCPDVFDELFVELTHAPATVSEEKAQMTVHSIAIVDNGQRCIEVAADIKPVDNLARGGYEIAKSVDEIKSVARHRPSAVDRNGDGGCDGGKKIL